MTTRRFVLLAVVASATLFAVGAAFHFGAPLVAPSIVSQFENNSALYRDWAGWTSTYMVLHPLWFGPVFAAGFVLLRAAVGDGWRGGLKYGAGVFAVGAFPVWLLMYASTQVSPEVFASFAVQSACQYAAAGAAMGRITSRSR